MLPLLALAALSGIAGYQYSKQKHKNKTVVAPQTKDNTDSVAKNVNTYNYYTNDSENGETLFGQEKKQKRNVFGNQQLM